MTQLERTVLPYENTSEQFKITKADQQNAFLRQYYSIYKSRLAALRDRVLENAAKIGDNAYKPLESLENGENCLIIGTVIKRISGRPSILKELAQDEHLIPEDDDTQSMEDDNQVVSLVSNKDYLEFEDEKQIVKLNGKISMDEVATGCVVGLIGHKGSEDTFIVEQIVWPFAGPQKPLPSPLPRGLIAILGGLELTGIPGNDKETVLAFSTFARWVNGELSMPEKERQLSANVERVLVAGDNIAFNSVKEISSAARQLRLMPKEATPGVETVEQLDHLIASLTSKMPVDLMGGAGDPCTQMWPQQPIHRVCLPKASINGAALGLRSNPYSFSLGGVEFLATSGQNVSDLLRMSSLGNSLDAMESLLKWQHIAPTAPDTLDAFPMEERDSLIMERRPHVMICGNQPRLDSRWAESEDGRTLLLALPRFSRTHMVTLLDLETLEISCKYFGAV